MKILVLLIITVTLVGCNSTQRISQRMKSINSAVDLKQYIVSHDSCSDPGEFDVYNCNEFPKDEKYLEYFESKHLKAFYRADLNSDGYLDFIYQNNLCSSFGPELILALSKEDKDFEIHLIEEPHTEARFGNGFVTYEVIPNKSNSYILKHIYSKKEDRIVSIDTLIYDPNINSLRKSHKENLFSGSFIKIRFIQQLDGVEGCFDTEITLKSSGDLSYSRKKGCKEIDSTSYYNYMSRNDNLDYVEVLGTLTKSFSCVNDTSWYGFGVNSGTALITIEIETEEMTFVIYDLSYGKGDYVASRIIDVFQDINRQISGKLEGTSYFKKVIILD